MRQMNLMVIYVLFCICFQNYNDYTYESNAYYLLRQIVMLEYTSVFNTLVRPNISAIFYRPSLKHILDFLQYDFFLKNLLNKLYCMASSSIIRFSSNIRLQSWCDNSSNCNFYQSIELLNLLKKYRSSFCYRKKWASSIVFFS